MNIFLFQNTWSQMCLNNLSQRLNLHWYSVIQLLMQG